MTVIVPRLPRGVRNHNAGNLRKSSNKWLGKVEGTDPEFEVFETPEHGIRALTKVLLTYYRKHGLRTVHDIIARYAPSSENNTEAYAAHVAGLLGIKPDEPVNLDSELTLTAMVGAIIRHECGRRPDGCDWYPAETLIKGVEMALET